MSGFAASPASILGRSAELDFLERRLNAARAGEGHLVLISGEAGVGKTRLIEELCKVARSGGVKVLLAGCFFESLTPYLPFREALRSGGLELLVAETNPRVEGAFLVSRSGLLVRSCVRPGATLDPDLFASMLTIMGRFAEDSFGTVGGVPSSAHLSRMDVGARSVILDHGPNATLAVVLEGRESEFLIHDVSRTLLEVEREVGPVLRSWDGSPPPVDRLDTMLAPLLDRYPGPGPLAPGPTSRRALLFENVALGLERATQESPVLLCIEDLQWADPSTLALVEYVARNDRSARLLIVGTFRPEDLVETDGRLHPLSEALDRMRGQQLFESLELPPLDRANTASLIARALATEPLEGGLADRLFEETRGNPLFVLESVRLALSEGRIGNAPLRTPSPATQGGRKIPLRIREVISRRLRRVSAPERTLIQLAAVAGELFDPSIVAEAAGLEPHRVLELLEEIGRNHALTERVGASYRFRHVMIKEVLYDELPDPLRREYHGLLARSVERRGPVDGPETVHALAFHLYRSSEPSRARGYLRRAATDAAAAYANAEAIRFYREALTLDDAPADRVELLMALESVLEVTGAYTEARTCAEEALSLVPDLGVLRGTILGVLARLAHLEGADRVARSGYEEALHLLSGSGTEAEAATLERLGRLILDDGDAAGGLEKLRRALDLRRRLGDERAVARALGALASAEVVLNSLDEAEAPLAQAREIFARLGDHPGLARTLSILAGLQEARGEERAALAATVEAAAEASRAGDLRGLAMTLGNEAIMLGHLGEYDLVGVRAKESLRLAERIGDQTLVAAGCNILGGWYSDRGQYSEAKEHLGRAVEISKANGRRLEEAWAKVILASALYRGGEHAAGEALAHEAHTLAGELSQVPLQATAAIGWAEIRVEMGDPEGAERLLRPTLEAAVTGGDRISEAEASRILGCAHRAMGRLDESRRDLERAVRLSTETDFPQLEAWSRYDLGRTLRALDETAAARAELDKAAALFGRFGMEPMRVKALSERPRE